MGTRRAGAADHFATHDPSKCGQFAADSPEFASNRAIDPHVLQNGADSIRLIGGCRPGACRQGCSLDAPRAAAVCAPRQTRWPRGRAIRRDPVGGHRHCRPKCSASACTISRRSAPEAQYVQSSTDPIARGRAASRSSRQVARRFQPRFAACGTPGVTQCRIRASDSSPIRDPRFAPALKPTPSGSTRCGVIYGLALSWRNRDQAGRRTTQSPSNLWIVKGTRRPRLNKG